MSIQLTLAPKVRSHYFKGLDYHENPFVILFDLIFTGIGSLYTYDRQALFGLLLQALLVTITFVSFAKENLPKYGFFT